MSIKLICSDIDGTLLQYGKKELEDEIFEQIRELHRRGILFCPASGWQYTSLRKLFAPVADCCVFLCENGGVIYKDEQCIAKNPMPRALAEEIANDLWTRSDGQGEVMLSGQNTAYLMERGLGMLKRIQFIGNNYQIIHDPSEVPEEITKVSVYLHEGVESYTERFVPRWKEANCAVAGPYWIDTTFANKGIYLEFQLGFRRSRSEFLTFLSLHSKPEPRPSRKRWSGTGCCVAIFSFVTFLLIFEKIAIF